jgi:hypothetical protein
VPYRLTALSAVVITFLGIVPCSIVVAGIFYFVFEKGFFAALQKRTRA